MGMQPTSGIVGGTVMRIPAIQSPNYNVAAKTGWAIFQTGQATFFSSTTSGEFDGTDFVINSAGIFLYQGTPALGNLLIALAPAAGTDAFGNNYTGGLTLALSLSQFFQMVTGDVNEAHPALMTAGAIFPGTTEQLETIWQSAMVSGQTNRIDIALISESTDFTMPVSGQLRYFNGVTEQTVFTWSAAGVTFPNGPGVNMGTPAATAALGTPTAGGAIEVMDAVLGNYAFTALTGHRYQAIVNGLAIQSTVAAALALVRIRNGGAGAPTIASPQVAQGAVTMPVLNTGAGVALAGTFAPAAGVQTLGVSTQRGAGTGTLSPVALARELFVVDLGLA